MRVPNRFQCMEKQYVSFQSISYHKSIYNKAIQDVANKTWNEINQAIFKRKTRNKT